MILTFVFIITVANICSALNVNRTIRLNSNYDCPVVGLGTGGFRTGGPPQDGVVIQMIRDAIDAGYRHIDTASAYRNEKAIGQALNEILNEGKVKREEIFITTKIYSNKSKDIRRQREAFDLVELALEKLNTTYIDLMLIHGPYNYSTNRAVWKGLEDALDKGLVKSIGVSNFNVEQLSSLLETAKVKPAMNQIESHPMNTNRDIIDYCKENNIAITAYSPLGAGRLIFDPTIVEIGKRHNKSAAQVMIRWQIQRGVIAIPKSTKKERIIENINVFDFSLTDDEMQILEHMDLYYNPVN